MGSTIKKDAGVIRHLNTWHPLIAMDMDIITKLGWFA